ncbi:MAG TPA: M20/M25/M40 family metallo-hydrolase [Terriglobales bacterium]|nr:M20/M25/M40 family metallo-hydrolase [Terriglobales bacterium]
MPRLKTLLAVLVGLMSCAAAQVPGTLSQDLRDFVATPAVSGYEQALADHIAAELASLSPRRDSMGDIIVTVGSGTPLRVLVAPLDEPGYVVSAITPDGYLRLQRIPTRARLPLTNALANAQPLRVGTRSGGWINGVMTGLSVHLQPGRSVRPDPDDLDNLYVDIGATSAADVARAGVDILSPVVLDRTLRVLGDGQLSGQSIGDRFGAAALVEALRHLAPAQVSGTVQIAFVTQQWTGDRGLSRLLAEDAGQAPQEVILVGRDDHPLARDLQSEVKPAWSIPISWPATPAETIGGTELGALVGKIESYLGAPSAAAPDLPKPELLPPPPIPARPTAAPAPVAVLQQLVAQYGVNPHEARVGAAISALLPSWAQPITDANGDIVLHWPDAGAHAPRILFVAHQDEIGFEVESIAPDGRLVLRTRGGGDLNYYLGHPILLHTDAGMRPGVLELPANWQARGFQLTGARIPIRADIGARTAAEAAQLGAAIGQSVTIPKQYRALLGNRATARSFDDRVGSSALVAAAWALGPSLPGRDVTFAWSTGEEIGLVGANAMAARMAAAGRAPDYVFAIDTFVSSDTPLESHRFADTPIGAGFVIRAIDDSSITPWPLAQRLEAMARAARIPMQLGETGGGNDGSVFVPVGSVDLPLGWPLRTSHSPGEVIDTRDLDSLSRMVALLSRSW